MAPKAVYGGWFLRQQPLEAMKTVLAHALGFVVAISLVYLFLKILWLIGAAVASLAFDVPFEFPSVLFETGS
jgi:hypothetical protein